jgi:hypothetical protein
MIYRRCYAFLRTIQRCLFPSCQALESCRSLNDRSSTTASSHILEEDEITPHILIKNRR